MDTVLINKLQYLIIGVQGENAANNIPIDMTPWVEEFPNARFHLLFKAYNTQSPLPMVTSYDAETHILTWIPTLDATQNAGVGYTEVRAIDHDNGVLKKSRIIPTTVENSVTGVEGGTVPEPYEDWVNLVLGYKDAAEDAQAAAETAQGLAEDAQEAAETAQGKAEDAEDQANAWATGQIDGSDVPATDPQYHNNAKYYSGNADLKQAMAEQNQYNAEAWAVGKKNNVDVGSSEPQYHNNAKYYSGLADAAQTAAETAQGKAETAQGKAEDAQGAAETAEAHAQGWATGGSGGTSSATNNSKYYSEQSAASAVKSEGWATGGSGGTSSATNNAKYYSEQAASSATSAATEKNTAAQWATGGTTGTPGATNNSKYYSEQSASSATAASGSKDTAAQWATGGTSGTPSATNNSKYYSEQSASSASGASSSATSAGTSAENAEAWAVGQRNGSDVSSDDPTYHNNSKYYSQQASSSATAAGNAQTAAETAQGKAEDAQHASEAASQLFDDADAVANTLPSGSSATVAISTVDNHKRFTFGIPQGPQGPAVGIDDTAGAGATAVTWSANKLVNTFAGKADLVDGKVPSSQLPSYVDDVLEYASKSAFPATGETGKIYVALDTNKSYRWSGSSYIELSSYAEATQSASGLMSSTDKTKLDGVATGATANVGTVTGVKMNNGSAISPDSNGVVNLGTVITDVSGKADKVGNATNGNFAALDANGNLIDSGHKHGDYVTDVSGKANKVSGGTTGNFAGLNASGDLTDSGKNASSFVAVSQGIAYSGYVMMVNSSGNVVPTEVQTWNGGAY